MKFLGWLVVALSFHWSFAVNDKPSTVPTYKVSVDAKLYSHYIERGLSMSDTNPAMNVAFLYNFGPQFSMGFWGSNISNISSADDNFWFKFLANVRVDFTPTMGMLMYINDDHYYKSSIRNGQLFGAKFNYLNYLAELEWTNNYQGTHGNSEYLNVGKLVDYKMFKVGGKIGYTLQNSDNYSNYFDIKGLGTYALGTNSTAEAGLTFVSSEGQFNGRAKPAIYVAISLFY